MAKKSTTKQVQATENKPVIPVVEPRADVDDGPFDPDGMCLRQREFVRYLLGEAGGNASRAAELAGYNAANRHSLAVTAHRLLNKTDICELISRERAKRRDTGEWTRARIAELAASSMANFITVDPDGKPVIDFEKALAAAALGQIKEYKAKVLEDDGKVRVIEHTIKTHDPTATLAMLARVHGLLKDAPANNPNLDDLMWSTSGELESQTPAGAEPVAPADAAIKPYLSTAVDHAAKANIPDVRNRKRPR